MWSKFQYYLPITLLGWILALISMAVFRKKQFNFLNVFLVLAGTVPMIMFIADLWFYLQTPPFHTVDEAGIWLSVFLTLSGLLFFLVYGVTWMPMMCIVISSALLIICFFSHQGFLKYLLPVYQSVWFIIHVAAYLVSIALLIISWLMGLRSLVAVYAKRDTKLFLLQADQMVISALVFFTVGLLSGIRWSQQAWGWWWLWNGEELFGLITGLAYLFYLLLRQYLPNHEKLQAWVLSLLFIFSAVSWFLLVNVTG